MSTSFAVPAVSLYIATSDDVSRYVCVLDDRLTLRESLEHMLEARGWKTKGTDDWKDCDRLAEQGFLIFVLDIDLYDDRTAGLRGLAQVKERVPWAICALVTEDNRRLAAVAANLRADHRCARSDDELKRLLERLEKLAATLPERQRAYESYLAMSEHFERVDTYLAEEEAKAAESALLHCERYLEEAAGLESLGDDFGLVVEALRYSLVNQPGNGLTAGRWADWRAVAEDTFHTFQMTFEQASGLTGRLESAGWNPEPPEYGAFAEFLFKGERDV